MNIIILLFALLFGSFLNVCIYRIPMKKSIAFPPSHCPKCQRTLAYMDLIPIISFLFNKGKCRYCGDKISWQYPFVEMLNGIIYLLLFYHYGSTLQFAGYGLLSSLLLVISVIDYDHQIIPDRLNVFGSILGIIYIFIRPDSITSIDSFLGMFIGGGIFLLIALLTSGAMGGGDIKLMAMLGLWFGWRYILMVTLLSFVIGAVLSILLLVLKIKSRKDAIPFGPFISISAFITILYGNELFNWYINIIL
ncbi:prepilin peptidase [Anaerosolibacter sp.]|uniref:prepilin peptidase n=1 Tax=Anaerosolibacter sp. TaxID=1872527 RepID=UPI0039F061B9